MLSACTIVTFAFFVSKANHSSVCMIVEIVKREAPFRRESVEDILWAAITSACPVTMIEAENCRLSTVVRGVQMATLWR